MDESRTEVRKPPTLVADWPAPPGVRAFTTLRAGGFSKGPHGAAGGESGGEGGGWNLGAHCGDDPRIYRCQEDS